MKWNIFKSKKDSLSEKLKQQNKELADKANLDPYKKKGIFKKSALFFKNIFGRIKVDANIKDQIEELLLSLDFGPFLSESISKEIALKFSETNKTTDSLNRTIKEELIRFYGEYNPSLNIDKERTNILLIVGSNGSGKTTSIAKLAHRCKEDGFKVLIVAGDTFRAGAVEQLEKWANKLGVDIFLPSRPKEDPAALIYKSLSSNEEKKYDLIICDTSGKQHNNQNLLQELNKIYKTIHKFDDTAPHETLLVVDSTIGQTSLLQAESFLEHSKATGIILTKMDHMLRGGIIFSIKSKFKVPVKLVGTGESVEDLEEFNLEEIIDEWTSSYSS